MSQRIFTPSSISPPSKENRIMVMFSASLLHKNESGSGIIVCTHWYTCKEIIMFLDMHGLWTHVWNGHWHMHRYEILYQHAQYEIIYWCRYCVRKCTSHTGLSQYRTVNPVCDSHFQYLIIILVRGDSRPTVAHTTDHFYNAVLSRALSDMWFWTSDYPFMAHF